MMTTGKHENLIPITILCTEYIYIYIYENNYFYLLPALRDLRRN